jgi:hypothetical protein
VHFDLVDGRDDAGMLEQGGEVVDREVADADGADPAVGEQCFERPVGAEGAVEGAGRCLVEDEQVDLLDAELSGALVEAVEGLVVAVVGDPDLRLEEHVGAVDSRGDEASREDLMARKAAARAALDRIEQLRAEPWTRKDSADRLRAIYEFRARRFAQRAGTLDEEEDLDGRSIAWQRMVRDVLDAQRQEVVRLRNAGQISDDVLTAVMRELDLDDQRLEI